MATEQKIGQIKLEGARIIFRNFSGKADKFNPKGGKRSFHVVIDDLDLAKQLENDGWNIKYRPLKDEDDAPLAHLPVKVNYDNRPPKIYIVTDRRRELLNEETVNALDYAEIESVDIVITPYQYDVNGQKGIAAYVKNMYVNVVQDEFADKYDFDEDLPFD